MLRRLNPKYSMLCNKDNGKYGIFTIFQKNGGWSITDERTVMLRKVKRKIMVSTYADLCSYAHMKI